LGTAPRLEEQAGFRTCCHASESEEKVQKGENLKKKPEKVKGAIVRPRCQEGEGGALLFVEKVKKKNWKGLEEK